MEEYRQLTLDDWLTMKESLKRDLVGVQESFVRIGYKLRKIKEDKLYEKDGYKSIAEFAKAEYNLGASTVSRFIEINEKYSIDGNSDQLRPEFEMIGSSKLSEMLSLPDSDLQMIQPETRKQDIRELKAFNKQEPEVEIADDIDQLIERFFEGDKERLKKLFETQAIHSENQAKEIINPSGNKVFRKGLYFMMMYENDIKIKKFGGMPETMTWTEFLKRTERIFGAKWQQYEESNPQEMESVSENVDNSNEGVENTSQHLQLQVTEEIAPAQKEVQESVSEHKKKVPKIEEANNLEYEVTEDSEESEENNIPEAITKEEVGQEITEDAAVEIMNPTELRKEYMDKLTICEMARYLVEEYRDKRLTESILNNVSELERWLSEEVDEQGKGEE